MKEDLELRRIAVEEIEKGELPKGSFIIVRWMDASDTRAWLVDHEEVPDVICKDWGLYLGVSGRKKKMLILGKDVVELHNKWGATRIPLKLIEDVHLVLPREAMMRLIAEIRVLGRRVALRRYKVQEERVSVRTL
ncbi:MAG: hypothetical protein NWE89_13875 [Candidatus Bathyarchaeota archaeon]|nr:hypothetical protein [Candidatus Bathyarchaeota archaeon]